MAESGRIAVTDLMAGNVIAHHDFDLWIDKQNSYGAKLRLQIPDTVPFFYNTLANGSELVMTFGHADVQADRPVTVRGEAVELRSKNSLLVLAVSKAFRLIYLFDDNMLADNIDLTKKLPVFPKPISLALTNALFKVTPANGCLLFGLLGEDFIKVENGFLFLTFGMYAYLPTLPDPYAANIGRLRFQFRGERGSFVSGAALGGQTIWQWLICQVQWKPGAEDFDKVEVSFHFAPLQNPLQEAIAPQSSGGTSNSEFRRRRRGWRLTKSLRAKQRVIESRQFFPAKTTRLRGHLERSDQPPDR